MNCIQVIGLSFLCFVTVCIVTYVLQYKELIEMQRFSSVNMVRNDTTAMIVDPKAVPIVTDTKILFTMYHLDKLDMLKPSAHPRTFFRFTMFPNVRAQASGYLNQQEIEWSMITAIKSSYKRLAQRDAIRNSWGGIRFLNGVRMHVIFVVALPESSEEQNKLEKEATVFGDLLQVNMTETYRSIGLKALAAMQWIGKHFPKDWLYFSGDDDMFPDLQKLLVNMRTMIDEAKKIGSIYKSLPIHCAFHQSLTPYVHRAGKWIVSEEEYPYHDYPPICLGGFYGLTVGLANAIYNASRHYPYFRHDDVFITGFMRLSVCDTSAGRFTFNTTDRFCALSEIQNSNFQHRHLNPQAYVNLWSEREKNMVKGGAKLIRA